MKNGDTDAFLSPLLSASLLSTEQKFNEIIMQTEKLSSQKRQRGKDHCRAYLGF